MKIITYNKTPKKNTQPTANKNKFKLYRIVWRDAYTETDEWHDQTTTSSKNYLCETTGYLVESDQNYYTIASTITQEGYYCSLINIPVQMVINKQRLYTNS